ncbi:MAG: histidine kinase [Bacteroidetes bacterium]|nr:histidine kinase [Bacteroidota bacterium]
MGNPFIKNSRITIVYALAWAMLALAHLLMLFFVQDIEFEIAIADALIFNALYFFIGLSLWYPTKFISFEHSSSAKILTNHLAAATITSGLWVLSGYFLLSKFYAEDIFYLKFLDASLFWRFLIGILFYCITVSINYVTIYYTNYKEKELKEAELRSLVNESELRTLKYQINPHFIFNSLNSISSLTLSDPKRAQEMTIKLSNFLRNTLSKNEKQKNLLKEELNTVRLYLDIEKIRFGDKFTYKEEISGKCLDIEVPSMILQPLFENAIKHGVYESIELVTIKISCIPEDKYLKISVENNFDPESVANKGEGIGLKNIANRLKLMYNQEGLLTTKKLGNVYTANVLIPTQKAEA